MWPCRPLVFGPGVHVDVMGVRGHTLEAKVPAAACSLALSGGWRDCCRQPTLNLETCNQTDSGACRPDVLCFWIMITPGRELVFSMISQSWTTLSIAGVWCMGRTARLSCSLMRLQLKYAGAEQPMLVPIRTCDRMRMWVTHASRYLARVSAASTSSEAVRLRFEEFALFVVRL